MVLAAPASDMLSFSIKLSHPGHLMLRKTFINLIEYIVTRCRHTRIMTDNMRAPYSFLFGRMAQILMSEKNKLVCDDAINRLELTANQTILEIGPGDGYALSLILRQQPKAVFAVEISAQFRKVLTKKFGNTITLIGKDACDLSAEINSESMDRIVSINTIQFLTPLPAYLNEVKRLLKPDGLALFACKFAIAKNMHPDIACNTDIPLITQQMQALDFIVTHKIIDNDDPYARYELFTLRKNSYTHKK